MPNRGTCNQQLRAVDESFKRMRTFFFLLFIVFIQEIHIHKSTNTSQFKLCSLIC